MWRKLLKDQTAFSTQRNSRTCLSLYTRLHAINISLFSSPKNSHLIIKINNSFSRILPKMCSVYGAKYIWLWELSLQLIDTDKVVGLQSLILLKRAPTIDFFRIFLSEMYIRFSNNYVYIFSTTRDCFFRINW